MVDALGNEMILGEYYGYSNRANGIVTINIGKAIKFNKKAVTLEIVKRATSIYGDKPTRSKTETKKMAFSSNSLFWLDDISDKWNEK